MCKRWKDDFSSFLVDMGRRPVDKSSIERLDNDKGYFPENCIWSDAKAQANNRRPRYSVLEA